jgi:hypothetical protein
MKRGFVGRSNRGGKSKCKNNSRAFDALRYASLLRMTILF